MSRRRSVRPRKGQRIPARHRTPASTVRPDRKTAEYRYVEHGEAVAQDVDDPPSVGCVLFEPGELADRDAAQADQGAGPQQLGELAVDLSEPGALLVLDEQNRAVETREVHTDLVTDRGEVSADEEAGRLPLG